MTERTARRASSRRRCGSCMLFAAGVIFVFLLFFADPAEGPVTQGMLMGSVASVITAMLLLLGFLDNPYRDGPGSLQPVAMERTLDTFREARAEMGQTAPAPCTSEGFSRERAVRGARHGAARRSDCGDGVERLPGQPLERRAGQGGEQNERHSHRRRTRPGPRRGADGGRRGVVLPVGERVRARRDASWRPSTSSASARSSSRR